MILPNSVVVVAAGDFTRIEVHLFTTCIPVGSDPKCSFGQKDVELMDTSRWGWQKQ